MSAIPLNQIFDAQEIYDEYAAFQLIDYGALRAECAATGVTLSEDPTEGGISKLNGIISQIDAQKTRVSTIVNESIKNDSDLEVLCKKVTGVYKREFDAFLPLQEGSNAGMREASANALLAELIKLKADIEGSWAQAKTFTKIVYNDLAKLDSTNKNISRQITVLQLSLEIGEIQRGSTSTHTF